MSHPYRSLPSKAFWKTAVADRSLFDIEELWQPKFDLQPAHRVATFGSCFAQHIGRALRREGFLWLNTEPAPRNLSDDAARAFNYDVFTCRTGNIYTVTLLRQWTHWALSRMPLPDEVWRDQERFFDPFRPNIEPGGFASETDMAVSRRQAIKSFRAAIEQADVFVFTLGLTESWFRADGDLEYPMCPGTVAGVFDADVHRFANQDYESIRRALAETIDIMREVNSALQFILTVSPVPLTATNSGRHVLVATMESKSILRSVAGSLSREFAHVDYFPSYEIINAAPFRGTFFEPNLRSVNANGVGFVMKAFFEGLRLAFGERPAVAPARSSRGAEQSVADPEDDVVCEEELLAAFAQASGDHAPTPGT